MNNAEQGLSIKVDEKYESTLESVDVAVAKVEEIASQSGMTEERQYELGMAVREIMVNAVVHGNGYNANKRVHVTIARTPDAVTVSVGDEGIGFLPEQQPDPLAEENLLKQSGRGMMIVQAYVDEVSFLPVSPSGTQVVMKKLIQPLEE